MRVLKNDNILVNIDEISRRISHMTGYKKGDVQEILNLYSEVVEDALDYGETVKHGSLFQLEPTIKASRTAHDGINKRNYTLPERKVIKFKKFKVLREVEIRYVDK